MTRKLCSLLLAVAVVSLLAVPAVEAANWDVDTSHSSLSFKVRHLVSKAQGQFTDWSGTLDFDPEDLTKGSAEIVIQTASVDTGNEDRDGHLKGEDFFEVEKYPTIKFSSTKVEKDGDDHVLVGNLTIRDITKEVRIPFEFGGTGEFHGTRAGFSGELTIRRKDFGMEWNKALDKGGFVLGDKIAIDLEIEAVMQQDESR